MAKYIHKLNVMLDDELNSKVNEYAIRQGYSVERTDLLIIAVSAGGIVVGLNILKFITEQKLLNQSFEVVWTVKWAAVTFGITIILNFISQLFAYKAHTNAANYAQQKIWEKEEDERYNCETAGEWKSTRDRNLNHTRWLNQSSIFTMIVGVILLSLFILFNF